MTPQATLWIILAISLVLQAAMAPVTWQLRRELRLAKRNIDGYAGMGVMVILLSWATLALWWYYALHVDQVLLGVIPTVGAVIGAVARGLTTSVKGKP